jgi:hypothetical protein
MMFDVGMDAFPFVCYGYCQLQKRMGRRGIAWIGQEVRWIGVLGFRDERKIGRWSKWMLCFTYFTDCKFSVMMCIWLYLPAEVFKIKFYYKELSSPRFYWKVESMDASPLLYGSQVLSYD